MKITDIFPLEITFWTTLWYIFLAYFIAFIVFNIYIYVNNLEYTINCEKNEKCFDIKPKHKSTIQFHQMNFAKPISSHLFDSLFIIASRNFEKTIRTRNCTLWNRNNFKRLWRSEKLCWSWYRVFYTWHLFHFYNILFSLFKVWKNHRPTTVNDLPSNYGN